MTAKSDRRVPVRLPVRDGVRPYLMGFFHVEYDVAVALYQHPLLSALERVLVALTLACIQDKRHPATYKGRRIGDDTPLAEVSISQLANATGLTERRTRKALVKLEAASCIFWGRGVARKPAFFAIRMDPPHVTRVVTPAVTRASIRPPVGPSNRPPVGPSNRPHLVFESVPDRRVKKGKNVKKGVTGDASEQRAALGRNGTGNGRGAQGEASKQPKRDVGAVSRVANVQQSAGVA